MPDSTPLRKRARALHVQLREVLGAEPGAFLNAGQLLEAAEKLTDVRRRGIDPGDPVLSGAHAVLDRELSRIWYARSASIPLPRQNFAQAHEYAHYFLHPDVIHDSCDADDAALTYASPTVGAVQGYSPAERREAEANLFAAELLLPAPELRRLFIDDDIRASEIARRGGLSESCVLAQLASALLLPSVDDVNDSSSPALPDLDARQREAAEVERGPLLVDAGPGTGKTRTLTARILHLLNDRGVEPEAILALTFSNRAAEEMRARLRIAAGDVAERVWIGTFHAFGFELLRKESAFDRPPRLIDMPEAVALLEARYDRLGLSEFEYLNDPSLPFPDILRLISRAKDELITPGQYLADAQQQADSAGANDGLRDAAAKSLEVAQVYRVYHDALDERHLLDFGDLIARAVALLEADSEVRDRWITRYRHVLADEYQDINRASARLLQLLVGDGAGFWAVGDLRQAIYRFRGASSANVTEFENNFPGGRRLKLDVNYRSLGPLVALFGSAARTMLDSPGEQRSEPSGWEADRDDTGVPAITVAEAEDEEGQGDGIASAIRAWAERGVALNDQAILCRTNRQANDLAARLAARDVPVLHLGTLFDRPEVRDLLAIMSLAAEPSGMALYRVGQLHDTNVSYEDVVMLLKEAAAHDRPFPSALGLAESCHDITEPGRNALTRLNAQIRAIAYSADPWTFLSRYLFQESRYLKPLLTPHRPTPCPQEQGKGESTQQLLAIYQLLAFALTQPDAQPDVLPLRAFLQRIRDLKSCGEDRKIRIPPEAESLEGVRLITVHGSKGLEFPVVYVPNLVHEQFPPRRQTGMAPPPETLFPELQDDEIGERYLFFVALTRARDHLVLSHPRSMRGRPTSRSPLLGAIQRHLAGATVQTAFWPNASGRIVVPPPAVKPEDDLPVVSLRAIEDYRECPRRYYYRRVLKLPEMGRGAAYPRFQAAFDRARDWLDSFDDDIPEASVTAAKWNELAEAAGLSPERPHDRVLIDRGLEMVEAARRCPSSASAAPVDLAARLPSGDIYVRWPHAESPPNGPLNLVRCVKRRARPDDHLDDRLAIARLAARQTDPERPVKVTLEYLPDGSRRNVPDNPRLDARRIAKYDRALQGIRDGEFPPRPDDRRCARCPFLFVCPS